MAALVTAMSMRPHFLSRARKPAATEAESATSIVIASARCGPIRLAVAATVFGSMSATATRAPSRAKASAMLRPIPRPAPVTSATVFFSRIHFSRRELQGLETRGG